MTSRKKLILGAGGLIVVVAAAGAGIAAANGGDGGQPITGPALERASAAALAHTGGGRVTETEAGDEEGAYEVEVTLDDGSQVDVHLDADFNVTGSTNEGPEDTADDNGGADND